MVFYRQLQQMDGKWNDKWIIIIRREMQYMSIGDENRDKSVTQHLPQTRLVACPHATQCPCSIQTRRTHSIVAFILPCIVTKTRRVAVEKFAEL